MRGAARALIGLSAVILATMLHALAPKAAGAQVGEGIAPDDIRERVSVVGIFGGIASNEPIFQPDTDVESVPGPMVGAFLDAPTGVPWFSIRAEGSYVQRGGDVQGTVGSQSVVGGVRADYLVAAVRARSTVAVGRARVHLAVGPSLDQLVRSRLDSTLGQVLVDEASTVFGVVAGVGVGGWVRDDFFVELEARIMEGLGDAYSGDFVSFRNRSFEVAARVGTTRWRR